MIPPPGCHGGVVAASNRMDRMSDHAAVMITSTVPYCLEQEVITAASSGLSQVVG